MGDYEGYKLDSGVVPAEMMRSYRDTLMSGLGLVGGSRQLKQISEALPDYANSDKTVSVVGPEGVGRRTLAKAIHLASADWWRPFIEADLAGVDDENSLRLLFGYREDHIFTAAEERSGLLTIAEQSTLCLRNFERYSKAVQDELCRTYLSRQFRPVSSDAVGQLKCRLIFTLRNRPTELKKGGFIGDDVCGMLSQKIVNIPPLSRRRDDIVPLAERFIDDCCRDFGLAPKKLSRDALRWLKKAPWNQNINQLKKSVYSACFHTQDTLLYPHHFALAHDGNLEGYQQKQLDEISIQSLIEMKLESFLGRLGQFEATHVYEAIMKRVEEPLLRLVLDYAKGNQIRASRMLGINRNTLRARLNKYNIKKGTGKSS